MFLSITLLFSICIFSSSIAAIAFSLHPLSGGFEEQTREVVNTIIEISPPLAIISLIAAIITSIKKFSPIGSAKRYIHHLALLIHNSGSKLSVNFKNDSE